MVEAHVQFQITALHVLGLHNDPADDLSRNHILSYFKEKARCKHSLISYSNLSSAVASGKPGLVLDAAVHYFCSQGIAPSTCSTYQ